MDGGLSIPRNIGQACEVDLERFATFFGYVMPDGECVSAFDAAEEDVQKHFAEVIRDESLYITVVDCHI